MSALPAGYNDRVIDPKTRMDHGLYVFSALPQRSPLVWPNGAKVAVAVVVSVEFGDLILPDGIWKLPGTSASLNIREFTYRDYGARVGLFRLMGILDELGIKATLPVSDVLLTRSPAIVEHALKRGFELAGHGAQANRVVTSAMGAEAEAAYIEASFAALKAATGTAPRGWLGPAGSESTRTTALLAGAGFDYTMDWGNDDQPFDFIVPAGRLAALPMSADLSDATVIQAQNQTPWDFATALEDHLETLLADGKKTGMVMTIGLQAQVSGQPFRAKHIRSFLAKAASMRGVWFATGSQIIDAYRGTAR